MDIIFVLLLLFSLLALFLGTINPRFVIRWGDKEKKNRRKVWKVYGFAAFFFFMGIVASIPDYSEEATINSTEVVNTVERGQVLSIEEVDEYPWGKAFKESLDTIGVEQVENIKTEVIAYGRTSFKITTNTKNIWCMVESDSSENWKVVWIKDYDNNHNYYYMNEDDKYVSDNLLKYDIYSYETNELVEKADTVAVENYFTDLEKDKEDWKEEQIREQTEAVEGQFLEIYNAFEENELVANDTYKGNRYTMFGTIETITEEGLANQVFNEIGVTITLKANGDEYLLFCKFEESERDKLKRYVPGDAIKFNGVCVKWGSWNDCVIE